jgi:hypothetical protein
MRPDQNDIRKNAKDPNAELKIASTFDSIYSPATQAGIHKLTIFRAQLAALFSRLEKGELDCADAKTQSLRIRHEISMLIWSVDDWQIQFENRN